MKKIIILNIIETPNAIISSYGNLIYNEIVSAFDENDKVLLSFKGLKNCNSAFLNSCIGELYRVFPSDEIKERLILEDIDNEIWLRKIEDTIFFATNSEEAKRYHEAVLEVLEIESGYSEDFLNLLDN